MYYNMEDLIKRKIITELWILWKKINLLSDVRIKTPKD